MRRLLMMLAVVTLLASVSASASLLDLDGAVLHVFEPEVAIPVPGGANATIKITPQSLNAGSDGESLHAQISLNDGCSQEDIVFTSIRLRVAGESDSISADRLISRNTTKLIVRFDRYQVIFLIGDFQGEDVTLEVSGHDAWGCQFAGVDTIKFKPSPNISTAGDDDTSTTDTGGAGETDQPTTDTDGSTDGGDEGSDTEQTETDESGSDSSTDGDSGANGEPGSDGAGGADSP